MTPRATATTDTITPATLERAINKRFGAGTMVRGSDPSLVIERLPSGLLVVDWALGGGFPKARHVELYGPPSTGKTSLAYCVIATTQANGGKAAFIDVEGKWDGEYAETLGVNINTIDLYHQGQQGLNGHALVDYIETLLRSRLYDLIVMDSIAALLPKAEAEASMEDGNMGTQQAKLMSQAMRKLTPALGHTCMLYINQVREGVGGVFVKRNVTSGGRAMGHYAAQRIELVRTETLKRKQRQVNPSNGEVTHPELPYGHRVLMRIQKEQTGGAREGDTATLVFNYDLPGFDHVEDLIYLGLTMGLVHKSGTSWWVEGYDDEKQVGRGKFSKWLRKSRAVAQDLEDMIREYEPVEDDDDE